MSGLDPAATKEWRRPSFYDKVLTPTLREAVNAQLEQDLDAQTSLFEELALMRTFASKFVAMYGAAVESGNDAKIMLAGAALQDALKSVADMCERAHRLREKNKERFSYHDVQHIVDQLVSIHHEVASDYQDRIAHVKEGDYRQLAALFESAVRDKLVLPNSQIKGTNMHPDETAALFDNTVPRVSDDQRLNDLLVDQMRAAGKNDMLRMETADG